MEENYVLLVHINVNMEENDVAERRNDLDAWTDNIIFNSFHFVAV